MTLCRCGKTLPEVSDERRYCAHCGAARYASCLNAQCNGMVLFQENPCCSTCGALYRYRSNGSPALQAPEEPFVAPLYDLAPSSGDPMATTAIYAKHNGELPAKDSAAEYRSLFLGEGALLDAQARHNRLYLLNRAGRVEVLNASTLAPAQGVRDISLPNAPRGGLGAGEVATLQTGASILLLRYQNMAYGYHAGSGEPLFQLSGEDFQKFSLTLSQGWLMLVGTTSREQRAYVYSIADLCQKRRQPFLQETLASSNGGANLPANRAALPHYTGFYVFAQSGELFHIEPESRVRTLSFAPETYIQAWDVSANYGAVLLHPDSSARNMSGGYELLTFDIGGFERHKRASIEWSPNRQSRSLLIEDNRFYALDKDLNLLWLSKDAPNEREHSDSLLQGAEEKNIEFFSIPYGAQPYVIFHSTGASKHYFAWGRPPLKPMRYITGAHHGAQKRIRLLYCGNRLFFVNMTNGTVQAKALPTL